MTAILPCAPGCCSSGIEVEEGCDCATGGSETFSSVPLTVDTISVESVESPVAADISDTKDNQAILFYCDCTCSDVIKSHSLLCSPSLLQDI